MADRESVDQEPPEPGAGLQIAPKGTQFLKKGYRDLDEAEMLTPTAVRFMLAEIDRLHAEATELKPFRDRSYALETRVAILEEKTKSSRAFEVLSGACLTVGAAMVGYSRYLWDTAPNGYVALGLGIALMVGGFVARLVKR